MNIRTSFGFMIHNNSILHEYISISRIWRSTGFVLETFKLIFKKNNEFKVTMGIRKVKNNFEAAHVLVGT